MNEAETRAELIDPKLKACGWGIVEGSKVLREYNITAGKIQTGGIRVNLAITTAPQGAKANFVNISGMSFGLKKDISYVQP